MTKRYPGGYITKTPPTVSTTSAPGIWTMEQQAAYQKAGTWPFGGPFNYIEDVFSTYLYTGNGSTQTITNGIDLAGQGGMTWIKQRSATRDNLLFDTTRGATQRLFSNLTLAQSQDTQSLTAFNADGFSIGSDSGCNINGGTYVSWTFRKQPKFFDVVTYTGNGSSTQVINHSLGARPGAIFFKKVSSTSNWVTYNRASDTSTLALFLNKTDAGLGISNSWMTSTNFTAYQLGADTGLAADNMNDSGATYVAYLFAHNAGGFGSSNTDNVISCGSFTTDGSGVATVNLGYEPQWVLLKKTSSVDANDGFWWMQDNMRGYSVRPGSSPYLQANTSNAEQPAGGVLTYPTATGFVFDQSYSGFLNANFIYIAIRRGPMKTPTSGTSVFSPNASNAPANGTQITTNFPVDLSLWKDRDGSYSGQFQDRLRGLPESAGTGTATLYPDSTAAESSNQTGYQYWNTGFKTYSGGNNLWAALGRAPSFMDVVCYTGNGSDITINHNLGVPPELVITKCRDSSSVGGGYWYVGTTLASPNLYLNRTDAANNIDGYSGWTRTATTYQLPNADFDINNSGSTYVAYLFASCPGVSKVGSYTGTGATQTISCGFAARFVMIKRTDSTGNWWFWTTASGMVAGTDNRLAFNTTSAQTNANWVYTDASGFQIVTTDATVNASGGSYIYLAIS